MMKKEKMNHIKEEAICLCTPVMKSICKSKPDEDKFIIRLPSGISSLERGYIADEISIILQVNGYDINFIAMHGEDECYWKSFNMDSIKVEVFRRSTVKVNHDTSIIMSML